MLYSSVFQVHYFQVYFFHIYILNFSLLSCKQGTNKNGRIYFK